MSPDRINLALRAVAAALAVVAVGVLVVGLAGRPQPVDDAARPAAVAATRPASVAATPSVESFGPSLARTLRPSLGEPAASPATAPAGAVEVAAASPARLRLVGTVGESIALIKGPDGVVALVEVGDDVEGADVVAIRDQQVDLRQAGRLIRLEKAAPPAGGAGGVTIR